MCEGATVCFNRSTACVNGVSELDNDPEYESNNEDDSDTDSHYAHLMVNGGKISK